MLALLAADTPAQSPGDVASLAASHPLTAIAVLAVSGAFGLAPSLIGRLKVKAPDPQPAVQAATQRVDATGEALLQLVSGLQRQAEAADRRADAAEAKHDDLERRYYKETNDLREQLRDARSKISTLELEVHQLRERLMRGPSG